MTSVHQSQISVHFDKRSAILELQAIILKQVQ